MTSRLSEYLENLVGKGHDSPSAIALVESFDGRKLVTLEGNASGKLPNGKTVRSGVLRKSRDLGDVQIRATLFGIGRFSKLDYA